MLVRLPMVWVFEALESSEIMVHRVVVAGAAAGAAALVIALVVSVVFSLVHQFPIIRPSILRPPPALPTVPLSRLPLLRQEAFFEPN